MGGEGCSLARTRTDVSVLHSERTEAPQPAASCPPIRPSCARVSTAHARRCMEMLLAVEMASVDSVREPPPDMHFNFAAQNEDDAACAAHGGRRLHDLALHARTHAAVSTQARLPPGRGDRGKGVRFQRWRTGRTSRAPPASGTSYHTLSHITQYKRQQRKLVRSLEIL